MTQKMKGLLKGLRYISQIFDDEKEEEMEIGLPTDVKHVAHIGWDGPSTTNPSWMNEFPAASESSSGPQSRSLEAKGNPATISSTKDSLHVDVAEMQKPSDAPLDSPTRRNSSKTKQSKRNTSSNGSVGSPTREASGISKPRRPKNPGLDSPTREHNRPRRTQNLNLSSDSPSQEPSATSKKSNRKKSKGSSGEGSTKSSRSKAPDQMADRYPFSDPGLDYGSSNDGIKSGLPVYDEGKECDEF